MRNKFQTDFLILLTNNEETHIAVMGNIELVNTRIFI